MQGTTAANKSADASYCPGDDMEAFVDLEAFIDHRCSEGHQRQWQCWKRSGKNAPAWRGFHPRLKAEFDT
jgi:hypothetical protein